MLSEDCSHCENRVLSALETLPRTKRFERLWLQSMSWKIPVIGSCFEPTLPGCSFICLSRPIRFDRTYLDYCFTTAEFS